MEVVTKTPVHFRFTELCRRDWEPMLIDFAPPRGQEVLEDNKDENGEWRVVVNIKSKNRRIILYQTRENPARRDYYGFYSNVSRGKRKKQDLDELIPCILEPDESARESRKIWHKGFITRDTKSIRKENTTISSQRFLEGNDYCYDHGLLEIIKTFH